MPSEALTFSMTWPTLAMLVIACLMRLSVVDWHTQNFGKGGPDDTLSDPAIIAQVLFLWWVLHLFYWLVRWP